MANPRSIAQTEEHFRKVFNREMTPEERRIVFIMLDDEPYPSSCWRQRYPCVFDPNDETPSSLRLL
jgi:hypothetical protein